MIKKMLSDRKGAAIELAILMTAVCLAVTTIVLSTALLQYENKVQAEQRMEENIIFEQIIEEYPFSGWEKADDNGATLKNKNYPGYIVQVKKKITEIKTVEIIKEEEKTLLTVTIDEDLDNIPIGIPKEIIDDYRTNSADWANTDENRETLENSKYLGYKIKVNNKTIEVVKEEERTVLTVEIEGNSIKSWEKG